MRHRSRIAATKCRDRFLRSTASLLQPSLTFRMVQMKNELRVSVEKIKNRLSYKYIATGDWEEAFNIHDIKGWYAQVGLGEKDFYIEYNQYVEEVPDSIAIIPFICNVLPIAWFYDADIYVDEIDMDFFNSIKDFKRGYSNMYPGANLVGRVIPESVIKNAPASRSAKSLVFFSGGVDANFTLLSHLNEKPDICTIWGSDLYFAQSEEWISISKRHSDIATRFHLGYQPIKSSFRLFLNYDILNKKFAEPLGVNWWHGIQHGIGIIGQAAPLVFLNGYDTIYLSSTYSLQDGPMKCASYPTIDPYVRYCGARVVHYDFFYSRQQKINFICSTSAKKGIPVELRVCWESVSEKNCGRCEKCARTLYGVLAEGADPNRFGFECTDASNEQLEQDIANGRISPTKYWSEIMGKLIARGADQSGPGHVKTAISAYRRTTGAA